MGLKNLFDVDKKYLAKYDKEAEEIIALSDKFKALSDEELRNKTQDFKKALEDGKSFDDIKIEAFAVCREACTRAVGLTPFKVQLMGGLALLDFNIAEMKTGEGKTLTAALPAYTLALKGEGVHIVTVNEYLAERDAQNIGQIFEFLGLSVGLNLNQMPSNLKREAYAADITYTTNSELGFDYLRDNMVNSKDARVQRPLAYAIIDEVDSILIDEARTPLIISGGEKHNHDLYTKVDAVVKALEEGRDYEVNLKDKLVTLTNDGIDYIEKGLNLNNLYNVKNSIVAHAVNNALKANYAMHKDMDYVVADDKIKIVDGFTGRILEGRAYSDGLHQAIEAKEHVTINPETVTQATITYQNFFRLYKGVAGMTGTAKTEEDEFQKTYDMDVVCIPTNVPVVRVDQEDVIFKNKGEKYDMMLKLIKERHEVGQPILIGTVAVETSEELSKLLGEARIPHRVLNAKQNESEAEIIAEAGQKGAVTIATNMAGRGTDIKISDDVKALKPFTSKLTDKEVDPSGLLIIGTERHEARRIDNQLRGRSGRQGDNGESIFFVSFDDDLLRRFIPASKRRVIDMLPDGEVVQNKTITTIIEQAQKQVESVNYQSRKQTLKYDDVIREQREQVYGQRNYIMENSELIEDARGIIEDYVDTIVTAYKQQDDMEGLQEIVHENIANKSMTYEGDDIKANIIKLANDELDAKIEEHGEEVVNTFLKAVMLNAFDRAWINHLDEMQRLRESIGLRGYGQVDPLLEYQKESRIAYEDLINQIEAEIVRAICKGRIHTVEERETIMNRLAQELEENAKENGNDSEIDFSKVGRNEPCPCGSGKKFKKCHGK